MTAIIVGVIAALATLGAAWIANRPQRKKVEETHRMLTVNHHESEKRGEQATILDRMDDIKTLVVAQGSLLTEHIKVSDTRSADEARRLGRLEEHVFSD